MTAAKIDVIICTKRPDEIRPELLETLRRASWVNKLIIEQSVPLSLARASGARKATTPVVGLFDDDVIIPEDWYPKLSARLTSGVVAVSSQYADQDPHVGAFQKAYQLRKGSKTVQQPNICNCLIRRDILLSYNPPPIFFYEDDFLYNYAVGKGEWITVGYIGVKHWYRWRNFAGAGDVIRRVLSAEEIIRNIGVYFVFSVIAVVYSRSLKTPYLFWKRNVEIIGGLIRYWT